MLEIYIYIFVGDTQWNFWEVMEQHVKNVLSNGSVKKVLHTIFQLLSELKLFQNKKINKIKLRKIMLFPLVGGSVPWHRLATCAMGHLSLNTMTSLWPPKPRAFLPVLRVTLSTTGRCDGSSSSRTRCYTTSSRGVGRWPLPRDGSFWMAAPSSAPAWSTKTDP